jgi:hypothetical protein
VLATPGRKRRISHLRPQRKSCLKKGNPPISLPTVTQDSALRAETALDEA